MKELEFAKSPAAAYRLAGEVPREGIGAFAVQPVIPAKAGMRREMS